MATKIGANKAAFAAQAERVLGLEVEHRVNELGGYGADGEVIYEAHPAGCPSVLVDNKGNATVTFMSNGSTAFVVKLADGMEVPIMEGSFDPVEKREIGVPASNVWLDVVVGRRRHIASLINPNVQIDSKPSRIRIVKLGDPDRAMWYCGI